MPGRATATKRVKEHIESFLREHSIPSAPLILGISGGADSTALLHAVSDWSQKHQIPLVVAHVDHGWRAESANEASSLERWCNVLGHKYEQTHPIWDSKKNLEAQARRERLKFFRILFNTHQAQALLLGHHRDDCAETIFKNICEGAHPLRIKTLKKIAIYDEMPIWRPLLDTPKSTLVKYCAEQNLPYFTDETNFDHRFLRGRLRSHCFPAIEENYGKGICKNLTQLGEELSQLNDYLALRVSSLDSQCLIEEGKVTLNLHKLPLLHPVEVQYIIRSLFDRHSLVFSREQIRAIANHLCRGIGKHTYSIREAECQVQGKILTLKFAN